MSDTNFTYLQLASDVSSLPSPVETHADCVLVNMTDSVGRVFRLILSRAEAGRVGSQIEGASVGPDDCEWLSLPACVMSPQS